MEVASALGGRLARLIGPLTRADRIARSNMERLLPPEAIDEAIAAAWENVGRTFFEYPHLRTIIAEGRIEVVGAEHLQAARDAGQGGVVASGHYSNWEILPLMAHSVGIDLTAMQRPPNNPYVKEILQRCRPSERVRYLAKGREGTRATFEVMRSGGFFGFLMDQRFVRGVKVDFMGSETSVAPTVGLLAQKYNRPIFLARCERLPNVRFRVTVMPPMIADYSLPSAEFQATVAQVAMHTMESWIREQPGQWFWMHRLWR